MMDNPNFFLKNSQISGKNDEKKWLLEGPLTMVLAPTVVYNKL